MELDGDADVFEPFTQGAIQKFDRFSPAPRGVALRLEDNWFRRREGTGALYADNRRRAPRSPIRRLERQSTMLRDDFPLIPGLEDIFRHEETSSRTLFSLVEDEAVVEAVIAATQKVVGDLSQPNTGILMVLPVSRALGLKKCP